MAKARHHYVPQFYLRFFASDKSPGKRASRINLYNLRRELIMRDASLRDQCYKRKFYGKTDELEDLLASLEGVGSWLLRLILRRGSLPPKGTDAYSTLLTYLVFQTMRTKRHTEIQDAMSDGFWKALLEENVDRFTKKDCESVPGEGKEPITKEDLEGVSIHMTNGAAFSLSVVSPGMVNVIDDLEPHLVILAPHRHLVTSDNPVVLYNQYFQDIRAIFNTGLASTGLQIFFPLSPHALLVLYDKGVYRIAGNQAISYEITDQDLHYPNLLQFANTDENVFFDNADEANDLKRIATVAKRVRPRHDVTTEKYDAVKTRPGRRDSTLVVSVIQSAQVQLKLSFLRVRASARKVTRKQKHNSRYRRELPEELSHLDRYSRPPENEVFVRRRKPKQRNPAPA